MKLKNTSRWLVCFPLLILLQLFTVLFTRDVQEQITDIQADLLHPSNVKEQFAIPPSVVISSSSSSVHSNITHLRLTTEDTFSQQHHEHHHPDLITTTKVDNINGSISRGRDWMPMMYNKAYHENLFDDPHHSPTFQRPPMEELVTDPRNNVIVGDVQFLLDFAIIGHAKCGTSTMMEWLGDHPQISCFGAETPYLSKGMVGLFVKRLYRGLDPDPLKLHGYKNPTDVQNLRALRLLREYFPTTKLFVGIRHPILWFQSFYNYRIQNTGRMPRPDEIGLHCNKNSQGVCGSRSQYHLALVRLGKTNYTAERDAFSDKEWAHLLKDAPVRAPNPVFLYDTEQLADKDPVRTETFRRDVAAFLGLTVPLDGHPHVSPGKTLNETLQAERDAMKLNICLPEHSKLRKRLLGFSRRAAHWIRTYFLQSPDVYVGNPKHFETILDSYMYDPCKNKGPTHH